MTQAIYDRNMARSGTFLNYRNWYNLKKNRKHQTKDAYVYKGYRGHGYEGETEVHIVGTRRMNRMTRTVRKWLKR
jgi:hypothetical protein